MDPIKQLLAEIKAGKSTFRPDSDWKEHMEDFQSVAKLLIYSHQEGLLDSIETHKESRTANNWYDFIFVQGGLSHKGEQYLTNSPEERSPSTADQEDILELRPNFMGLGINLNALCRHFKKNSA